MAKKKQLPAKGGSKGKSGRFDRIVVIGIIVALAAIGLILWGPLKKFQYKGEKAAQQQRRRNRPLNSSPSGKLIRKRSSRENREGERRSARITGASRSRRNARRRSHP